MSGSGGGGYAGGDEGFNDNCENLVVHTQLSSPKSDVIQNISEGDVLDVGLQKGEQSTVVVVMFNNQVAGGVACPQIHTLRTCIEKGTDYKAVVQSIKAGQVKVKISARHS